MVFFLFQTFALKLKNKKKTRGAITQFCIPPSGCTKKTVNIDVIIISRIVSEKIVLTIRIMNG